ncbi:MAG: hypothetical protein CSB47_00125 [Proteobacteria bacterium]|nr:MAG: hypothetical protein CSB47_00125 [Pseudomonadota bacterium]
MVVYNAIYSRTILIRSDEKYMTKTDITLVIAIIAGINTVFVLNLLVLPIGLLRRRFHYPIGAQMH